MTEINLLRTEFVLENWRDGDMLGWDHEFDNLNTYQSKELEALTESVRRYGMLVPVQLGSDGRVWDGHHRLCVANALGIALIPTQYV